MHSSRLLPFIFLLIIAAALVLGLFDFEPRKPQQSQLIGTQLEHFDIAMLNSTTRFTPDLWKGKVAVISVFASWCIPCGVDHAFVTRLAQANKAPVYGIDWKDTPEQVNTWLKERGNPYTAVGEDSKGEVTIPLGLTGVPEVFVIAANGKIAYNFKAPMNADMVDHIILPLIEQLQKTHE